MPNLTGRPVLTKDEEIAANLLRKQGAKAARSDATTSRVLGDMAVVSGPSEAQVATMRVQLINGGGSEALFSEFIEKMNGYGWRGKTLKQVNTTVSLWFHERLQAGSFKPRGTAAVPAPVDMAEMWISLCGNAETDRWTSAIQKAGCGYLEEQAMASAARIADAHSKTLTHPAWDGVKEIGRALGTCAYLFQISELAVCEDGSLLVSVLHPHADVGFTHYADPAQIEAVRRVIVAITGRDVSAIQSALPWVGMSARRFSPVRPF